MTTATITSKGQVTIPKIIRSALHLDAGDKIEIVLLNDEEALIRPISKKVSDVFGRLKRENQPTLSVAEINDSISKRFSKN